jgi:hypothetical protein
MGVATGAAAAYDERRQIAVVFPGIVPFVQVNGTYERSVGASAPPDGGSEWSVVPWSNGPRLITLQNALWEPQRGRLLVYGAPVYSGDTFTADRLWEWNDAGWANASVVDAEAFGDPGKRVGFRWTYDVARRRAVLYGGTTPDVWELESANRRPAEVVTLELSRLGVPALAEHRSARISLEAGGDGLSALADGGWAVASGVDVQLFTDGAWRSGLGSNQGTVAAPATLVVDVPAALVPRAFDTSGRAAVAFVSNGVNGNDTARVSTRAIELTLQYRLPK